MLQIKKKTKTKQPLDTTVKSTSGGEKNHTSEPPAYFLKNRNIKLQETKYYTYTQKRASFVHLHGKKL